MERHTELELIDQVLDQLATNTPHLADKGGSAPVSQYNRRERLEQEINTVFRHFPIGLAHVDEIPNAGDYILRNITGISVIVIRGTDNIPRAFLNACRHRGAQLLSEPKGNVRAISCPYHAWTYRRDGSLALIPGSEGFCDLDKDHFGLVAFPSIERYGILWATLTPNTTINWEQWFNPLDKELSDLDIAAYQVFSVREVEVAANWKAINDSFMEGYHFRIVHKNSVAQFYCDNQGVFTPMGPHYRYFLSNRKMVEQKDIPREQRKLRPNCLMVYQAFPITSVQVLPDHLFIHNIIPIDTNRSIARNIMLIPDSSKNHKEVSYWERSKAMVQDALDEDHTAAEGVQRGISSGLNPDLVFGRFEQGIVHMHQYIDQAVAEQFRPATQG
ncbi:MAG: aromatic ring-hydroxylating dioxygenase subunit alpha [Gammaproteobacteria bacterium]|nr:aromatic ring-hydroxylating dioxygenase subunit alpha [Gammaproteobacteria bacterium]